jgi:hypothetical protein
MQVALAALDASLDVDLHVPRGVAAFLPGTVLAALSAVLFAVGSVLQHGAAAAASDGGALKFRDLVGRPSWLVGQGATLAATGLQVAALALAPVAIVQPLLAGGLVVALGLRAWRTRCWPARSELGGAVLTAGGLAVFLVSARPAPGVVHRHPSVVVVILAVLVGLLVVVAGILVRGPQAGAVACGAAAGLTTGLAAVLISSALEQLSRNGLVATLAGPELWGAVVTAVAAQVAAQQAFSRGSLTWSLPALTVLDPLAAVPIARYLIGERLAPGHAAVWLPAGLVAAVGTVLLARGDDTCRRPIGRRPAEQITARTTSGRARAA